MLKNLINFCPGFILRGLKAQDIRLSTPCRVRLICCFALISAHRPQELLWCVRYVVQAGSVSTGRSGIPSGSWVI